MEPLPIGTIARAIGGSWERGGPPEGAVVREVSTDTRTLSGSAVFFALSGERFDGHAFVAEAKRRGALASVVARGRAAGLPPEAGPYLSVDDPLAGLERLASWNRGRAGLRVVAVTGSVGKTTTKGFIAAILSRAFRVCAAPKSFNNRIGVATTLIRADASTEVVVAELGASAPGEIAHLSRIARPDAAVVTEIAPAHLAGFGDLDGVVAAKAEIFEGLADGGVSFLRRRAYGFERLAAAARGPVRTFGWDDGEYAVRACRRAGRGYDFELVDPEGARLDLSLSVPGRHNVLNAAAAAAVARELGMPWEEIREGLLRCRLPPSRLAVFEAGGVEIVDDSYNANPASMAAAISEWLALGDGAPAEPRRLVAVLGEMLELGPESGRLHEELGIEIAAAPLALLVTVGRGARPIGEGARARGAAFEIAHVESAAEALEILRREIREGDRVLLKGSRRIGLDAVASELSRRLAPAGQVEGGG